MHCPMHMDLPTSTSNKIYPLATVQIMQGDTDTGAASNDVVGANGTGNASGTVKHLVPYP